MAGVEITGSSYIALLAEIKAAVTAARIRAAHSVNHEMVTLYWQVGRLILQRQEAEGWGTKVIDRLSIDLRTEFPGMRGFGTRSLVYMRTFAAAYPTSIAQEPPAQLPWRHIMLLLDKVPDTTVRDWYAAQDVQHGWSSAVLSHHITTGRHTRVGIAPNNFPEVLAPAERSWISGTESRAERQNSYLTSDNAGRCPPSGGAAPM